MEAAVVKRPETPAECRDYLRTRVVREWEAIAQALVRQATSGSAAHLRMVIDLVAPATKRAGVVEEEPRERLVEGPTIQLETPEEREAWRLEVLNLCAGAGVDILTELS